jgi:FixJ family two-component response regulator
MFENSVTEIVPSEREQRVIELVAQGLKNREVADAIGDRTHRQNCLNYHEARALEPVELALWYEARRQNPGARLKRWRVGSRIF